MATLDRGLRGRLVTFKLTLAMACGLLMLLGFGVVQGQQANTGTRERPKFIPGAAKTGIVSTKPDEKKATPAKAKAPAKVQAKKDDLPGRPARVVRRPTLNASGLDSLIDAHVKASKAPVSQLTTDEQFVRRVYLDLAGRLPTPPEIVTFLNFSQVDKRARLINHLLNGPDFPRTWARYWRDVIENRSTNEVGAQVRFDSLEDWLTEQFAENRPWDEIANDLIAGEGQNDEVGAVNFTLAHASKPVELAGEVSRVFLGIQIQCAECHDHPSDPWTRKQFHELAAFFAGTRQRRVTEQGVNPQIYEVISQGSRPTYRMPDLADPSKSISVDPAFFLADSASSSNSNVNTAKNLNGKQRRQMIASYISGQDNPWFARSFVNRVWYELLGEGFYVPVDDIGPTRDPYAAEVIENLAEQWQQGGYDVRWLFRTIMNTKTYQRQSRSTYSEVGRTPFASNYASRLSADQIADALAQALEMPLTAEPGERNRDRERFRDIFSLDPSTPNEDVLGTIPQALYLMNDSKLNRALRAYKDNPLGKLLDSTPNDRVATDLLYIHVLARRPYPAEVELVGKYRRAVRNRREAFEDLLWCLVNSTEFISRR